jgi:hypothetical protein
MGIGYLKNLIEQLILDNQMMTMIFYENSNECLKGSGDQGLCAGKLTGVKQLRLEND